VTLGGKTFTCGPVVVTSDSSLGDASYADTTKIDGGESVSELYHLITSDGTMIVDGVKFHDYRRALDRLL